MECRTILRFHKPSKVFIVKFFCVVLYEVKIVLMPLNKLNSKHSSRRYAIFSISSHAAKSVNLCTKKKVKERIVLREIHLRTTGRHLSNGITQCYLLPDRGGRPAFTPTGQVGTRFIDPVRMKG